MKTAIYIRTSTEDQNPENQLKDCQAMHNPAWGETEVYRDQQSAWKDNKEREDFERLRKDIKGHKINHLIVWDFDRIYRNRAKFKEFLGFLKAYGVSLHSYRQAWMEDLYKIPAPWNEIVSELVINIFGHMAEDESKKKSDRVKLAQVKKEGSPTMSYKGNKWGRKSISSKVDQKILNLYSQGLPIRKIAKQVIYYDDSRNEHTVSVGYVHKLVSEKQAQSNRNKPVSSISQ